VTLATAGIVALLLGAVLVYFKFPRREEEERLLGEYHAQDTRETAEPTVSTKEAPEPIS
jgi:hypothetical protein